MLRKFEDSFITSVHPHRLGTEPLKNYYIIQTERISDECVIIEYFDLKNKFTRNLFNKNNEIQDNEKQAKIDEYKAITLNTNNFNDKWSGHTLGELFEANDREFIERAKKEMKNEYIKERIIFLDKELNGK